jgi:sortase B
MSHASQEHPNKMPLSRILILVLACGIFLFSGYQILGYFTENRSGEQLQQELIDQAVVVATEPAPTTPVESVPPTTEPVERAPISVDFAVLQAQNPDIVGWIYSEGTVINYPILQGVDNQQYLRRLYDGTKSTLGSIFLDFRNLADFSDLNSLIYGHNIRSGQMFASLSSYREQEYYEEHPVMWLLTPDADYRIDLIAGMVVPSDSEVYEIYSYPEELEAGLEYVLSHSTFDAGEVDPDTVERIVTLSTCSYDYNDARYVVIGSLQEVARPEPAADA